LRLIPRADRRPHCLTEPVDVPLDGPPLAEPSRFANRLPPAAAKDPAERHAISSPASRRACARSTSTWRAGSATGSAYSPATFDRAGAPSRHRRRAPSAHPAATASSRSASYTEPRTGRAMYPRYSLRHASLLLRPTLAPGEHRLDARRTQDSQQVQELAINL